ncbi:hypothetical protein BZG36_00526 [Bifiguratus adelaidae]|uniref:Beta-hexosaminidase n=1 Tax=Bifiguratus adelaidae TaxID=1938954 RepID=A0A261Y793_9FUNG|nr:hypothetical protein BZG36_00526 [Bifiguratus adelaidae]
MKFSSITSAITLAALTVGVYADVFLWPQPQSVTWGDHALNLPSSFKIELAKTHGTSSNLQLLSKAINRYEKLIWKEKWTPVQTAENASNDYAPKATNTLTSLSIIISDPSADLELGTDESYTLNIPQGSGSGSITAKTVWGAMRALETFSQLVQAKSPGASELVVAKAPVTIKDKPAFTHRGVMLDTARNYYPVADILRTIDAVSYNKMNVLHLHLTDSQSFPLDLQSVPDITKGAYVLQGKKLLYTKKDVQMMVEYARERGVRLVPEIDMPAHSASWGAGYKDITTCTERFYLDPTNQWSNRYASEPTAGQLNPTLNKTYEIVNKVIDEVTSWFPDGVYHVGGDEPVIKCWEDSNEVRQYMKEHNVTGTDLLGTFLSKAISMAKSNKKRPTIWEDAVTSSNLPIDKETILQVWTNPASMAINAGYQVIASNYNFWYLDCGHGGWNGNDTTYDEQVPPPIPPEIQAVFNKYPNDAANWAPSNWGGGGGDWCSPFKSWQRVYSYDLTYNLTKAQSKQVLGGEVCLWSEQSDTTTLDTKLWPRSAASAEVMWSGRYDASGKQRDIGLAMPRIFDWRYRLLARGIRAEPLQPLWCGQHPHMCDLNYPF